MSFFIVIVTCLLIAWQDFRTREIHIAPLILLGVTGLMTMWRAESVGFLVNGGIIGALLLVIHLVYFLKGERQVMNRLLGWGDVWVLVAVGCWLDPQGFVWFYCLASAWIALGTLTLLRLKRIDKNYLIPFAGWLCIAFVPYFAVYQWIR